MNAASKTNRSRSTALDSLAKRAAKRGAAVLAHLHKSNGNQGDHAVRLASSGSQTSHVADVGGTHLCATIRAHDPYHHDFFYILGYPEGFHYRNRYQRSWVDDNVWAQAVAHQLAGRRILLIFQDQGSGILLPVRWGVITRAECIADTLYFEYALREIARRTVDGKEPDESPLFAKSPELRAKVEATTGFKLVFFANLTPEVGATPFADDAWWYKVVRGVAKSTMFLNFEFLRIHRFTENRLRAGVLISRELPRDSELGYELSAGGTFALSVYQVVANPDPPDSAGTPHRIELDSPINGLRATPHSRKAVGKYDLITFQIRVDRVVKPQTWADLEVVSFEGEKEHPRRNGLAIPVYIARPPTLARTGRALVIIVAAGIALAPFISPVSSLIPASDAALISTGGILVFVLGVVDWATLGGVIDRFKGIGGS